MWPFQKAALLDDETARWHVDTACWVLRKFRGKGGSHVPRLILPGKGFYRLGKLTGHDLALAMANQTKALAGLNDLPLTLVRLLEDDPRVALQPDQDVPDDCPDDMLPPPDGTEVMYFAGSENEPFVFITAIIRALASQVVTTLLDGAESNADEAGALRDLTACLLGFGIFLDDIALRTEWRQGARYGYSVQVADSARTVSIQEIVFDLALFLTAYEIPADDALRFIKADLTDMLKTALRDMDKYRTELLDARKGF
jgi:hypothetical protein